jgi:NADH-quinone oxidoreductase subunit N
VKRIAILCPGEEDHLQGLDRGFANHPAAAVLLAIAVLSLAGVPPFPGFFAKLFVFKSVVASGYLVPALIAFGGSFVGLAYYLGIVIRMFANDSTVAAGNGDDVGATADAAPGSSGVGAVDRAGA